MVCDISLAAGQKLARAVEHAKAKAKREALEELEARGFELSADLEEARVMEGRLALLIVPDGGEDASGEECREFIRGETGFPKEEERLLAQGLRSAGKRKVVSWHEKACGEAPPPQRLGGSDLVGRQASGIDASSHVVSALDEAHRLGLVAFDKPKVVLLHCEAPLREAREMEKSLKFLCAAKENELVSLRHGADQSRARETLLEKQLEDKAEELEQLRGEVGKAKREFTELQAHVRAHSEAKERAQATTSALDAQIQAARANDSARVKMIARLSSELSKAKTEVVNVRVEVVMNNTRAGQKMAAHLRSADAAKAELKNPLD
ncbi:uncharacterized protein [Nicotiana sylvestris]|uniref:uncharacterized protein n=1 Tax=Nicotiana sylvestris TaxID=4096 RepID=UPI00388C4971